eukprot:275716-Pyramimonas_sp.AAC.3
MSHGKGKAARALAAQGSSRHGDMRSAAEVAHAEVAHTEVAHAEVVHAEVAHAEVAHAGVLGRPRGLARGDQERRRQPAREVPRNDEGRRFSRRQELQGTPTLHPGCCVRPCRYWHRTGPVNEFEAPQRGKVGVSFCRCRQVSKPAGAKAGLVQLNGDVGTVRLDVSAEEKRLERLETTLLPINEAPL